MSIIVSLFYGLAIGHVGAGYYIYANYPRRWKVLVLAILAVCYLIVSFKLI